ncbi:MAG: hypothetical protein ACLPVF_17325 [Acidimicrobiales bacterium]
MKTLLIAAALAGAALVMAAAPVAAAYPLGPVTSVGGLAPGQSTTTTVTGCAAGVPVTYTVNGIPAGTGVAGPGGAVKITTKVTPGHVSVNGNPPVAVGVGTVTVSATCVNPTGTPVTKSVKVVVLAPSVTKPTLVLTHHTLVSGESVGVSGAGCVPGIAVPIYIDGKLVGQTTANSQGAFSAAVTPDQVGQLVIRATCGSKTFVSIANVVATSASASPAGSAAVFGVFVLLGVVLLRGQITGSGNRRRRQRRGAADILEGR